MSIESSDNTPKKLHVGKPHWLRTDIPSGGTFFKIQSDLKAKSLVTVCQEAKCPNIAECWNTNTATFMVLGDTCTRACRFCHIKTGNPEGLLDPNEPDKIAQTCLTMKLRYVVITMVDRDDLPDGGAAHLARVITAVKEQNPGIIVEILAGDFHAKDSSLQTVLKAKPEVFAHNIETVETLTPRVRDARASYRQSLAVLSRVKELADYPLWTKSALMLGLGETNEEITTSLKDLREHHVDFLTIGQYMRPTKKHLAIKRWVEPSEFKTYEDLATSLGFQGIASAPLVRSSYRAREFFERATARQAAQL